LYYLFNTLKHTILESANSPESLFAMKDRMSLNDSLQYCIVEQKEHWLQKVEAPMIETTEASRENTQ